jgi:hypothetical protein
MPNPDFPLLEVVAISDATTLIVAGPGVDELAENDELYVVAVGESVIPKTDAPYVVPKAKLEVTFQAGVYAIARPPVEEVTVKTSTYLALEAFTEKKVRRRPDLQVDEKQMIGAPKRGPIKIGDQVVRAGDLASFIAYLAAERKKQNSA